MPPLAPERFLKAYQNRKASKVRTSLNPNQDYRQHASPRKEVSSPSSIDSSGEQCFLIPAAVSQELPLQSGLPLTETRTINLRSISSNFYCLPVRREAHPETYIYISTRASFPTASATDSASPQNSAEDGRTLLLTNICRDTTVEDLKNLFSSALGAEASDIEAVIQCPQDHSSEALRVNLIHRESCAVATSSTENKKAKKISNNSPKQDKSIPPLMPEATTILMKSIPTRFLPNAYVKFKTPEQLRRITMIRPSSLPLRWPVSQNEYGTPMTKSWSRRYREVRKAVRPSVEVVSAHADVWMTAFDAGLITPIASLVEQPEPTKSPREKDIQIATDDDIDDAGGWTTVTRGGQHGRSSTLPTQHASGSRPADPYAQSSMSGRDAGAAVKVMKRGFAQAFSKGDGDVENDRKRKGGELNRAFYRVNVADSKKAKMNELKQKFQEDKARVERMKNSRKFKPY